jgi:hypothetical protein
MFVNAHKSLKEVAALQASVHRSRQSKLLLMWENCQRSAESRGFTAGATIFSHREKVDRVGYEKHS